MSIIPVRRRPDPFPKVQPIWEYQADTALSAVYADYKRALQVPWVGVAALAFAGYPDFFNRWWQAMAGVVESRAYVEGALSLRTLIEDAIDDLNPPPISGRLRKLGYSNRELDEIRGMVEFFSHGNFIQIPAFFSVTYLLEGGAFSGGTDAGAPYAARHAPDANTQFVMMEPHHVAAQTKAVYDDVMAHLKLPFVNSDYRALSRWPSYFACAWNDLKVHIDTEAYEALTLKMHNALFAQVAGLPDPTGFTARVAVEAANRDAGAGKLLAQSRVFTYLIPGLVTNIAFLRRQLME